MTEKMSLVCDNENCDNECAIADREVTRWLSITWPKPIEEFFEIESGTIFGDFCSPRCAIEHLRRFYHGPAGGEK